MIERRPFENLAGNRLPWLNAKHHFLPSPSAGGWGSLLIWNDDEIAPACGFPLHPHENMEIVTYVRRGAVTHQDSLGNSGRTAAGDVQVMSAGTGIRHAEFNLESGPTQLFQIWIKPTAEGGLPAWGTKVFPKAHRAGPLVVLASGYESDVEALPIRAKARVLGATLLRGQSVGYDVEAGRYQYLVPASGHVRVNGLEVKARDGAAVRDIDGFVITAVEDSEIVLVDAPGWRFVPSSKAA